MGIFLASRNIPSQHTDVFSDSPYFGVIVIEVTFLMQRSHNGCTPSNWNSGQIFIANEGFFSF